VTGLLLGPIFPDNILNKINFSPALNFRANLSGHGKMRDIYATVAT
jgi:hypothetical protein